MANVAFPTSPANENLPCRQCAEAMERLLLTISRTNSEQFKDVIRVLEQALSMARASCSTVAPIGRCQFCLLAPEITRMGTECELLLPTSQFSMENLSSECRTLKVLLQSIVGIRDEHGPTNSPSSTLSPSVLDGAHDLGIEGGDIANVVGSSNFVIFIRQELGVGFRRSVLVLLSLLVAFVFFRMFLK
ncbi:hypothetical protein F5887DRAFT_1176699 [Amanita rubescens]|nr:hypothetical protein F5887DRAFT_1176699 [Amanita rubescens]